jgi:hypothetical protein
MNLEKLIFHKVSFYISDSAVIKVINVVGIKKLLIDTERSLKEKFDTTCSFNNIHGTITKETGSMGKTCGQLQEKAILLCEKLQAFACNAEPGRYSKSLFFYIHMKNSRFKRQCTTVKK